jgi:uncharacterized membrane protein YbaN (DUF454 family)
MVRAMSETERQRPGTEPGARPHASPLLRAALWTAGTLCVVLGAIGAVLPILPTVPFLLLAAACYARSSERFHRWLLGNRWFGPTIREWEARRCIPARSKALALGMIVLAFGTSTTVFSHRPPLAIGLAACGLLALMLVARVPRCEAPE